MKSRNFKLLLMIIVSIAIVSLILIPLNTNIIVKNFMRSYNSDSNLMIRNSSFSPKLTFQSGYIVESIETESDTNGIPKIYLFGRQNGSNSTVEILKYFGNGYDCSQNIVFDHLSSEILLGDINGDFYSDIIDVYGESTSNIDAHLQNPSSKIFYKIPNSTYPMSYLVSKTVLADMSGSGIFDVFPFSDDLKWLRWNSTTSSFIRLNNLTLKLDPNGTSIVIPSIMRRLDINQDSDDEIIIYGKDAMNHSYFLTINKRVSLNLFNTTIEFTNLTGAPTYNYMILSDDINGDFLEDLIAVNSTGIYFYYQTAYHKFPKRYNMSILTGTNLKVIGSTYLNPNSLVDLVGTDGIYLYIYHDIINRLPPIVINPPKMLSIRSLKITYVNSDDSPDIIIVGTSGTNSEVYIFYQEVENYFKTGGEILMETISAGALASVTALGMVVGQVQGGFESVSRGTSGQFGGKDGVGIGNKSESSKIDLGIKRPGKWFKRKKMVMYTTSLGLGSVLSLAFIFLIYPIVLSSPWLVWMGAIIGPIGFFYGTYDFVYVGLYTHKGNLWKAYYKGKTKFFWDVFSWAKPILTIWCTYTTVNMFLILTFSNLFWTITSIGILCAGMIGLLLLSIYGFKVDKIIEVDELRKKSLDYIKQKKNNDE